MDMTSAEELGLVWMGDMLLHNDPSSMMMNSSLDPHRTPFFTESQPSIDELRQSSTMYVQDMNNFMMLDDIEDPYFDEDSKLSLTDQPIAQTSAPSQQLPEYVSRKIKPIKHPALKLQTPIAYQKDTDPNVIPIKKDGMAICEKCGAMGVKHAFYTKERRFCSMACARGSSDGPPPPSPHEEEKYTPDTSVNVKIHSNLPSLPPPPPLAMPDDEPMFPPDSKKCMTLFPTNGTYDWLDMLVDKTFKACSVSSFNHAPMANNWDNITVGMKVEVENTDCEHYSEIIPDSFWVATVVRIAGYKALLRYEGFGSNESKDFWINLCSSVVHPVGWCATRGKPLIPPRTIEEKYHDWKHFLVKRLTGARTLPSNFYTKVHENLKSRFRCDLNLEVVDKNRISQVKVATIKHIIGKRLHVKYYDADSSDNGFWAHEDSPLIHPVGWAKRVGQTLAAPPHYVDRCLKGLRDKDDATEDLFPLSNSLPYHTGFRRGMKLEAVDPLNLASICVSTIMKVLNEGYLLIKIESYDEDLILPGSDWFCFHSSSACILPPGFCHVNNISLTPPKGYDVQTFNWSDYLTETGEIPAPTELFDVDDSVDQGFEIGQKLEVVDLMDPRLICVATISRIVGRLVKIHFDGWEEDFDQWMDSQSPDMYPVGWCELHSYKLEGPHNAPKISPVSGKPKNDPRTKKRRRGRPVSQKKSLNIKFEDKMDVQIKDEPNSIDFVDNSSMSIAVSMADEPGLMQNLPDDICGQLSSSPMLGMQENVAIPDGLIKKENLGSKIIPKLIASSEPADLSKINPGIWSEEDVGTFLSMNNCGPYREGFSNINGKTLLTLTKDQVIDLTGKKVGPSLKIFDLIQQLKGKVNPSQLRVNKKNF